MTWALLFIPAALTLLSLLLFATAWLEQQVLSPRSLIVYSARARRARPDHVEVLVAAQSKRLLDAMVSGKSPSTRP